MWFPFHRCIEWTRVAIRGDVEATFYNSNSLKSHHKFVCKKFCVAKTVILSSVECNHYQLAQNGLKLPS